MAKLMLVRCSPRLVEFFQDKKRFHIIVAQTKDDARRLLEKTSPDLLPDLVIIGDYPNSFPKRKRKREIIEFAQSLKVQFRRIKIVLLNGMIFKKRAPECAYGVAKGRPEQVFNTIQDILSPNS